MIKKTLLICALAIGMSGCGLSKFNYKVWERWTKDEESVAADEARVAAIKAAVDHPNRPRDDRARDATRKPVEIMTFAGFEPGMRVLDFFASAGWYTELLSRTVGPEGEVYAHNPPPYLERFGDEGIRNRLAGDRLANVVRHDRPMEALELPSEYFDAVMMGLVFHDLFWMTDDVPAVVAQVHRSLKPGGIVLVTDHAAPLGSGDAMARDIRGKHRIDEALAREIFTDNGFVLVADSDLLRNVNDDRSKAFFEPEMRGVPTDRFVLKFRKDE